MRYPVVFFDADDTLLIVSLLSVVPLKIGGNVSENAVYCKNTNTLQG